MRPDGASCLAAIEPDDWVERTSWRPLLALACQHGLLSPPLLPEDTSIYVCGCGNTFTAANAEGDGAQRMRRAVGGVAGGTYLFALPGSPGACRDGWEEILKQQLDNRHRPCNLVELMPRLEEHRR